MAQSLVDGRNDLGARIVRSSESLRPASSSKVLTRSDTDRAALIGRRYFREDGVWLAELLMEIESDPDDITRLMLIETLKAILS